MQHRDQSKIILVIVPPAILCISCAKHAKSIFVSGSSVVLMRSSTDSWYSLLNFRAASLRSVSVRSCQGNIYLIAQTIPITLFAYSETRSIPLLK